MENQVSKTLQKFGFLRLSNFFTLSLLKEFRSIDNFSGDSGPQFLIVPVINRSNKDQTPAFYGKREEETGRESE